MSRTRVETASELRRMGLRPHPKLVRPAPLRPSVGAVVLGSDGRGYVLLFELSEPGHWFGEPCFPVHKQGGQDLTRLDLTAGEHAVQPWPVARAMLFAGLFAAVKAPRRYE